MKKPSNHEIESIVQWHLNSAEPLGDQVGSSGHLGRKSLSSLKLNEIKETAKGFIINFDYTIVAESEFTIYPDNPPPEILKSGTLLITEQLLVEFELERKKINEQRDEDNNRFLDSFLNW